MVKYCSIWNWEKLGGEIKQLESELDFNLICREVAVLLEPPLPLFIGATFASFCWSHTRLDSNRKLSTIQQKDTRYSSSVKAPISKSEHDWILTNIRMEEQFLLTKVAIGLMKIYERFVEDSLAICRLTLTSMSSLNGSSFRQDWFGSYDDEIYIAKLVIFQTCYGLKYISHELSIQNSYQ